MPREEDWSDSDDELADDIETPVLLGVPDGRVEVASDLLDAAVSRIGGKPALLSPAVPFESCQCNHCRHPMELLVQIWCPFESSPFDRALYIWGCANSGCQRQQGCVRAWRGLRFNDEYAAKLQTKEKPSPTTGTKGPPPNSPEGTTKINPFSMSSSTSQFNATFELGSELLDNSAGGSTNGNALAEEDVGSTPDSGQDTSADSIVVALASATLSDSPWNTAPNYPALYLSTVSEYIRPEKRPKGPAQHSLEEDLEGGAWSSEKYENSLEIDHVFDRFNRRVSADPEQCVRYELGGTPLPFATDDVFKNLFPRNLVPSNAMVPGTKDDRRRLHDPGPIPRCPSCQGSRNEENSSKATGISDEERRSAVRRILKGGQPGGRGMEWGTILVFSCEKDCSAERGGWKEEFVLVQWDS